MSEALKRHWQQATLDCPRQGDCPSPEELRAGLRGLPLGERRELVLDALAGCARCAAIARLAVELPPQRSPWPQYAWAASLLLALVAGALLMSRPPAPDVLRGGEAAVEPADGARLQRAPRALRWSAESAVACRVELRDAGGALLLASASQRGGELALVDIDIGPGRYLWLLRCAGETRGPYAFSVAP